MSQCEWLSVTNCDNVYGSDIIARVFRSSHEYSLKTAGTKLLLRHGSSTAKKPLDMIIVPVDSRSFKGKFSGNVKIYIKHHTICHPLHVMNTTSSPPPPPPRLPPILFLHLHLDPKDYPAIKKLNVPGFDGHCRLLDSNLQHSSLGYTIQPLPTIKHMDLASIFLRTERFFRENVKFGEFFT